MEQNKYILRQCCPSCSQCESELFLKVPDFRVSKDDFPIHRCLHCNLHYTKIVPSIEAIGGFYKSDSYDSHRLDNKSLISRVYRVVRGINLRKKMSWLKRYAATGVLVDYGCGLGHFVMASNLAGYTASGYEIDDDVRELARKELGLKLSPLDSFFDLQERSVDVLTLWHVLEHVYNLNDDFSLLLSKVKIGGTLMIAVPNFRSYDALQYGKFWEAYDVPRHLYHFDCTSLIEFVENYGLEHKETIPMKFDSYYVSMRSEKNLPNGSFLRGLMNGFVSNSKGLELGYSSHVFVFKMC